MSKLQLRVVRPHCPNQAADNVHRIPVTPGNFAKIRAVSFVFDVDATVATRQAYLRQYKERTELVASGLFHNCAWIGQTAGQSHHHNAIAATGISFAQIYAGTATAHGASFEQVWDVYPIIWDGEFSLGIGAENRQAGDSITGLEIHYWDGPLDLVATAI